MAGLSVTKIFKYIREIVYRTDCKKAFLIRVSLSLLNVQKISIPLIKYLTTSTNINFNDKSLPFIVDSL